ncbi:MAG: hypothetical protein QOJ73_7616 [Streptosporangiaceae bacterium]|nr:hypothetical protein [Streptosporangiaceae bacterium]
MTDAQRREDAPRERSEPRQHSERSEPGQHSEPRQPTEASQPSEAGQDSEPGSQSRIQHDGIVDLLGLLAYAELDAYFRLTEDAALAPSLADRAALAGMAVAEFGHFRLLGERLTALGAQPDQAMLPFAPALDAFHARTAPADWLEGLVKAYVGDGIAADFYRAVAELVDPQTRELVLRVLADTGHAEFVIARVRAAIAADPHLGGRLALWARRLVGEALAQAYRVVADRQSLAGLLAGASTAHPDGTPGSAANADAAPPAQLGDIGRMFARITDAHAQRMAALGLAS